MVKGTWMSELLGEVNIFQPLIMQLQAKTKQKRVTHQEREQAVSRIAPNPDTRDKRGGGEKEGEGHILLFLKHTFHLFLKQVLRAGGGGKK